MKCCACLALSLVTATADPPHRDTWSHQPHRLTNNGDISIVGDTGETPESLPDIEKDAGPPTRSAAGAGGGWSSEPNDRPGALVPEVGRRHQAQLDVVGHRSGPVSIAHPLPVGHRGRVIEDVASAEDRLGGGQVGRRREHVAVPHPVGQEADPGHPVPVPAEVPAHPQEVAVGALGAATRLLVPAVLAHGQLTHLLEIHTVADVLLRQPGAVPFHRHLRNPPLAHTPHMQVTKDARTPAVSDTGKVPATVLDTRAWRNPWLYAWRGAPARISVRVWPGRPSRS